MQNKISLSLLVLFLVCFYLIDDDSFFPVLLRELTLKYLVPILFLLYLCIGAIHNDVSSALGIVSASSIPAELLELAGH